MIDYFKEDYFWMLREGKGYFPWLSGDTYKISRYLRLNEKRKCMCRHDDYPTREVVRTLVEENVCENPLFDLILKSLLRAEIRFISRFVPQRSHEERLTGNLVSEIDSALFLIKTAFRETSYKLYSQEKEVDFFYYDLSRGGKIEKITGADLGFILVIDLPDFPYTVKTFILQAKKILNGSSQIDLNQYKTLNKYEKGESGYLFYDMDLDRQCSPLIVPFHKYNLHNRYEECVKANNNSFTYSFDGAKSDGHPLSLFLISQLAFDSSVGKNHRSFDSAFYMFEELCQSPLKISKEQEISKFDGRLAIFSIGKNLKYSISENRSLVIKV